MRRGEGHPSPHRHYHSLLLIFHIKHKMVPFRIVVIFIVELLLGCPFLLRGATSFVLPAPKTCRPSWRSLTTTVKPHVPDFGLFGHQRHAISPGLSASTSEENDNSVGPSTVAGLPSSSNDNKTTPAPLDALGKFLHLLYRGATLPFPNLRNLSNQATRTKKETGKVRVGFSLRESVVAIVVYLALGVVSYSSTLLQHDKAWSMVDALYFGGTYANDITGFVASII